MVYLDGGDGEIRSTKDKPFVDTHTTFATVHRKVAIRQSRTGLFESRITKQKGTILCGTIPFYLAETARFELAGDCSLTDFESAPL